MTKQNIQFDSLEVYNDKLKVWARNTKTGERIYCTGSGIKLSNKIIEYINKGEKINLEKEVNELLLNWDGKESLATKLKKQLELKYGVENNSKELLSVTSDELFGETLKDEKEKLKDYKIEERYLKVLNKTTKEINDLFSFYKDVTKILSSSVFISNLEYFSNNKSFIGNDKNLFSSVVDSYIDASKKTISFDNLMENTVGEFFYGYKGVKRVNTLIAGTGIGAVSTVLAVSGIGIPFLTMGIIGGGFVFRKEIQTGIFGTLYAPVKYGKDKIKNIKDKKFIKTIGYNINKRVSILKEELYKVILMNNIYSEFEKDLLKGLDCPFFMEKAVYYLIDYLELLKDYFDNEFMKDLSNVEFDKSRIGDEKEKPYKTLLEDIYNFCNTIDKFENISNDTAFSSLKKYLSALEYKVSPSKFKELQNFMKTIQSQYSQNISESMNRILKDKIKNIDNESKEIIFYTLFKNGFIERDYFDKVELLNKITELDNQKKQMSYHINEIQNIINNVNLYATNKIGFGNLKQAKEIVNLKV